MKQSIRRGFAFLGKNLFPKEYRAIQKELLREEKLSLDLESLNLLKHYLIIGEDRRFFNHIGFDPIAIARAFRNRFIFGKREGASTIHQQLVRVTTGEYERTLARKIKEILLATTLDDLTIKDKILEKYLSVAYYGTEMQNLNNALQILSIKKSLSTITASEIIARIKYPEPKKYSDTKMQKIKKRSDYIRTLSERYARH